MGTRAAAFTAKIRNLNDYRLRLLHGAVPAPSGLDIANTLKYFSQTLLGVLRDIQERPMEMLYHRSEDAMRRALFPNLDYAGLHQALVSLVDIMPLIQYGTHAFGQALLNTLACQLVFLDRNVIDTLPYLVASMMTSIPESLHQHLITTLCCHILPFTVGAAPVEGEEENYAAASVPALMMMIFQYTDNSAYHCELLESLMSVKKDVVKDLLCVIAFGTPASRRPAANLLFYYWPNLNPTLYDRRGIHIKFSDISSVLKAMFNKSAQAAKSDSISQTANSDSGESKNPKGWKPLLCQIEECDGEGTAEAGKVCLDHVVCLGACPDNPPPLYMCLDCAEDIRREYSSVEFHDILMPMGQISATCENKNCRSNEKNAVATCYSLECASYNSNRPIRYCSQCNNIRHNNRRGTDHIVHATMGSVWAMEPQMQNFTMEAIVSLLNEAQPFGDKTKSKDQERLNRAGLLDDVDQMEVLSPEEARLLSRYGVWLIIGLCAPTSDTPDEMLGRLLAALCHWFNATQYLPDGSKPEVFHNQQGTTIERLKSEYIHNWLQDVCKTHFEVFVSCLLPHPVEYARVGGHWDTLATRTDHIKEGFNRLFCLVPYELVTVQVWDRVMPHWMEAIHNEIPEDELADLKITLSKLLDSDMSPLGFDASQMYKFISVRFVKTTASVQEQTLSWMQILSSLNIVIPMNLLLSMFTDGVSSLCHLPLPARKTSTTKQDSTVLEPVVEDDSRSSSALSEEEKPPSEHPEEHYSDPELNLTCFVLMLDVLLKQMEVQEVEKHQGIDGQESATVMTLICNILNAPCMAPHTCDGERECTTCELTTAFFQLKMDVSAYLCPRVAIQNNKIADIIPPDMESSQTNKSPEVSQDGQTGSAGHSPKQGPQPPKEGGVGILSVMMANMPQIVTATVETVGELDIAANMPQEHVVKAVARAVTLTEEDVANATANIDRPSVVGEDDEPIDTTQHSDDDSDSFWITTQGKFKFKLEDLPPHLQVIYTILLRLESSEDSEVVYHMCGCLKYLVLHGEAMAHAANENRGFLIWCQENKTIKIMWNLIDAEWSHVAELCVMLLLHFITLPCGSDIFWKLCENNFNHQDWKTRFQAVEKVVVIGRFLGLSAVRQCPGLQAAIAHAFCFLIASLDDINVAVAQRASLYLMTLPDSGLRALCWCLEQQFDSVILDRPMIIQALHQLSSRLPDRRILTWDFFFQRFDALYLEAQIALERYGDIAFPRDLRNSDMTSDVFERKLSRAKDALTLVQSASVRTLSGSLGTKWPYKRTMSAPANMVNRTVEKQQDFTIKGLCTMPCKLFEAYFIDVLQADGGIRSGDDSSTVQQLQRALDLEETDKDTLHLLVFLFMQFLSQPQHAGGNDDKGSNKSMKLVLRHLSVLMGFNPQDRCFAISPGRLRSSPVFNAFLSNLAHVLDHNFGMGTELLSTCLPVLQFCSAPHRVVDLRYPTFSLWCLQPHPRRYWLKSVLTLLYKYEYSTHPLSGQALSLIRIVINTIDNHFHRCRKVDDTGLCATSSAYSREVSQGSLGGNEGDHPGESPPLSPGLYPGSGRLTVVAGGHHVDQRTQHPDHKSAFVPVIQDGKIIVSPGHHKPGSGGIDESRKHRKNDSTLGVDCDDTEPELAAIPESPKTDSPSCQESYCELEPYENLVKGEQAVIRLEQDHNSKAYIARTPCATATATATIVIPQTIRAQAVTSVMASQIQAFHESFTVKIHNAELAPLDVTQNDNKRLVMGTAQDNTNHQDGHSYQQAWILGDDDEDNLSEKKKQPQGRSIAKPKVQRMKTVDLGYLGRTPETQQLKSNGLEMKVAAARQSHLSPKSIHPSSVITDKAKMFRPIESSEHPSFGNPDASQERLLPVGLAQDKCGATDSGCSRSSDSYLMIKEQERKQMAVAKATVVEDSIYSSSVIEAVMSADSRTATELYGDANQSSAPQPRSPQSTLSMMDLMTLGSPVELDGQTSTTVDSTSMEAVSPSEEMELPTPERLLPVGGEKLAGKRHEDLQPGSILERVWQAFGGWTNGSKSSNQSSLESELVEVIAQKESLKQVKHKLTASQRHQMERQEQNTSTEETTETSNSGITTNNSGDGFSGKGGMHDRSKAVSVESEEEGYTDGYKWSDRTDISSVRGCITNNNSHPPPPPSIKQSSLRVGEDCVAYRCMECGEVLEEFSNEDLGLCIIILSTFVYRQPGLAAPLLPKMLKTVARVSGSELFSWQFESSIHFPGSATSIGRQFLRCVLHQLAPNQIFNQIFYTSIEEHQRVQLFKTLAQALTDFNELNPSAPIQLLLENLNSKKVLPTENLCHMLSNVATYMECVGQDYGGGLTSSLVPPFDTFLRKVLLCNALVTDLNSVLRLLVAILKIPGVSTHKNILDPISKLMSYSIQNCIIKYDYLCDLCHLGNRIFSRERDKLLLPRLVVYELVQALKFKTSIPDTNLVLLVQLVVQDSGGTLGSNSIVDDLPKDIHESHTFPNTCAAECMRSHLHDALEFIADVHTLTKVKSNCRSSVGLNEDTMGGLVKAGISQYLALEITRGNGRDNRAIAKYLPWLNNIPTAVQQGPKEFIDCVSHIRLLSWLLLGALTHTSLMSSSSTMVCQPIPPEASCHIADHIQVILAGFAEQSKASVLHMSSLFHAFILCQLWTVYLEQVAGSPGGDSYNSISAILTDFWAKVTPGILQLVSSSKVDSEPSQLGEMVNLHFLSLMEALHECQSTVLTKLLPLWAPVLYTHHSKLPGQLAVRLQACQNAVPPSEPQMVTNVMAKPNLHRWLHRLQFKMGQIELQSSAATQFYSV